MTEPKRITMLELAAPFFGQTGRKLLEQFNGTDHLVVSGLHAGPAGVPPHGLREVLAEAVRQVDTDDKKITFEGTPQAIQGILDLYPGLGDRSQEPIQQGTTSITLGRKPAM